MAVVDISRSAELLDAEQERRAELDKRDREHGGMLSLDVEVAEQARKDSMRGWAEPYRAEVTRGELAEIRAEPDAARRDAERIDAARLLLDCRAAVRRFSRLHRFGGVSRPETVADVLATDAAILIYQWPSAGGGTDPRTGKVSTVVDLGGKDSMPARRVWLVRIDDATRGQRRWKLSDAAWRVLLAAVKQAARTGDVAAQARADAHETPSDDLPEAPAGNGRKRRGAVKVDLTADVEEQARRDGAATRLPDISSAEIIARYLDISLDAARAIVARAYPAATPRDLAESWNVSESSLKVSLSRGAKRVRQLYPEPADLLDALESIGPRWRADLSAELAYLALNLRTGRADAETQAHARIIARDWRGAYGELSPERRAVELAARHATRRAASVARRARLDHWQGLDAERVSASVRRIVGAEMRRARATAETAARGAGALRTPSLSPALARPISGRVEIIPPALRAADYRRTAVQDRAERVS